MQPMGRQSVTEVAFRRDTMEAGALFARARALGRLRFGDAT